MHEFVDDLILQVARDWQPAQMERDEIGREVANVTCERVAGRGTNQ